MDANSLMKFLDEEIGVNKMYLASNGWIRGCCPVHGENNPSWGICTYVPHHPYKCFFCGEGNLVSLTQTVLGIPRGKALRLIGDYGDVDFAPPMDGQYVRPEAVMLEECLIAPYEGKAPKTCAKVLGFSREYLKRFRIGYDFIRKRVVFPWFVDGELVGATGRKALKRDDGPKTIPYFGMSKGNHLYLPYGSISRRVVVVEGERDALSVARVVHSVAALGWSNIAEEQARFLLDNATEITLLTDPDEAGEKVVQLALKHMSGKAMVYVAGHPEKDPGEMTPLEVLSCIHRRKRLEEFSNEDSIPRR